MSQERLPPPQPDPCLIQSRKANYRGGTLIAEEVWSVEEHERRLRDAEGYRPEQCAHKTLNGARVGDLFMSIIHTAELAKSDVFGYLVALQRNHERVAEDPAAWMPWNYSSALTQSTGPAPPK